MPSTRKRIAVSVGMRLDVNVAGAACSAAAVIVEATSTTAGVSGFLQEFGLHFLHGFDVAFLGTGGDEFHLRVCRGQHDFLEGNHGGCWCGRARLQLRNPRTVICGDGRFDFARKPDARHDLHSGFEAQFVQKVKILRLGHRHNQFVRVNFNREGAAGAGHRGVDQSQGGGINLNGGAVEVGNSRDFDERGDQIRLRHNATLEQQLAKVNELALLILNCFIEFSTEI